MSAHTHTKHTHTHTGVIVSSVIPSVVLVSCLVLSAALIILTISRRWKNKDKHKKRVFVCPPPHKHVIVSECYRDSTSVVQSPCRKYSPPVPVRLPKETPSFPSALVLYSPNTPMEEKKMIVSYLITGLKQFGIDVKCPDVICIKDGVSYWLEKEIKKSTVLCVCNNEMKTEWESDQASQLIGSLRQLLHGLVSSGLSGFATVIMQTEQTNDNLDYIPTDYLKGQTQFIVRDEKDIASIAHYILDVPLYTTNST